MFCDLCVTRMARFRLKSFSCLVLYFYFSIFNGAYFYFILEDWVVWVDDEREVVVGDVRA